MRPGLTILFLAAACLVSCADGSGQQGGPVLSSGSVPVTGVVDGDTVNVRRNDREETIRLIGIDTPEVDWYGGQAECYGARAGQFTEGLLDGERVRLELDLERRDQYGRTLAYLYLDNGRMVNVILVRRGFARVTVYPPNDRYEDRLRQAEAAAREDGAGLWSACR